MEAAAILAHEPEPQPASASAGGTKWEVLDHLDKGVIGARHGRAVTVRQVEPAGCLLFGPYWQLPAGHYRLLFECQPGPPRLRGQPVLGIEIIVL
ncbi:MAG: hypothetical protein JO267_02640, partial [Alphaproteobacteria bacterium]|nr:hypothetical protein [Alphaproteobacteria bacterium]